MGDELYYLDKEGARSDAKLHETLLANPSADLAGRRQSFVSALARGISRETARQMYGADADDERHRAGP